MFIIRYFLGCQKYNINAINSYIYQYYIVIILIYSKKNKKYNRRHIITTIILQIVNLIEYVEYLLFEYKNNY